MTDVGPAAAVQARSIEQQLLAAVGATRGHFRYESGHHGDLWLELDGLLVDAQRMRGWAAELARRAAGGRPEIVCGPRPAARSSRSSWPPSSA
jgi:hypothetical protein